jgi:acetyl esterase/lipase
VRCIEKELVLNYPAWIRKDAVHPLLRGYLQIGSEKISHSFHRPAVIICPGGCYRYLSEREGDPVAMRFLAAGMHAFVLQYSVAPNQYPAAFLELAAAVSEIRANAEAWNVDPRKIFVCGFSAGGHLCASLGTDWKNPILKKYLPYREDSWKPDGMILCYPAISMAEYGHEECRRNLMGDRMEEWSDKLSWQKHVTKDTVPAFIWATFGDEQVPVENALLFAAALRGKRIPCELHLYEQGEHGLALCDETTSGRTGQLVPDNAGWINLAINWVGRR